MYRSNQTDHSPPSISHIVNSRHKSTSPAFEFELPSPQPSPNRYARHLSERQFGDTSRTAARMVPIYTICHHSHPAQELLPTNQPRLHRKTTTSKTIITNLTFHVPTCPHFTSICPSEDHLDLLLCILSRQPSLGPVWKRMIKEMLSIVNKASSHSPLDPIQ